MPSSNASFVDTRDLTEAVFRSLEARKLAKAQMLQSEITTDTVVGDPQRIEQVLVNLIVNALKYTPDGSQIEVIWQKDQGGATLLKVKDNGPGIPQEHQDRLFERFYRVDPGRSREQGGTGLGLSIVKHIMLKHGGSIRVVSDQGRGSEFICRFPDAPTDIDPLIPGDALTIIFHMKRLSPTTSLILGFFVVFAFLSFTGCVSTAPPKKDPGVITITQDFTFPPATIAKFRPRLFDHSDGDHEEFRNSTTAFYADARVCRNRSGHIQR